MRSTAQLIGLLVAGFLPVTYTYAYGPLGHDIVGEIATAYLCETAADRVTDLLDGQSLGYASRWPDWIRRDPEWQKSRPWHYINVADDALLEEATGAPEGDVIWAIGYFRDELANPALDKSRRAEALRFLAHFIADVHQPLHVGRKEDRGGNSITVAVDGRAINLHKFWDAQRLMKADRERYGSDRDAQLVSLQRLVAARFNRLQSLDELDWARESQALRDEVYSFEAAKSFELEASYRAMALEITRNRLAAAGIRLANTLNDIFCGDPGDG